MKEQETKPKLARAEVDELQEFIGQDKANAIINQQPTEPEQTYAAY